MKTFTSFEEKSTFFNRTTIMDIDSLINRLRDFEESVVQMPCTHDPLVKRYFFRGVSNASYRLYSSMQRCCCERCHTAEMKAMRELSQEIFDRFCVNDVIMEAFRQEVSEDNRRSEIAMWAFIQHYGGPSHLVDFTSKVEHALYFAVSGIPENWVHNGNADDLNNYISLYICLDAPLLNGNLNQLYSDASRDAAMRIAEYREQNPGAGVDVRNVNEQMIVQALEPMFRGASVYGNELFPIVDLENGAVRDIDYHNERIKVQDGNFFLGDIERCTPLEVILRRQLHEQFYCLDIHKSLIREIREAYPIPAGDEIYPPDDYSQAKEELRRLWEPINA